MDNEARILEFLHMNPDSEYNINQISRLVGVSIGSAFKILKDSEKKGYVKLKRENNAFLYRIDENEKTRKILDNIENEKNKKIKHKTKVMCTIGRYNDPSTIKRLIEKGMNVARIDAYKKDRTSAFDIIKNIRKVTDYTPILIDIPGKDILSIKPWIKFAVKNDLDFISISYVSNVSQIEEIYQYLGYSSIKEIIGGKIKLFVKIKENTLRKYKEIIEEVYGVILDRDLMAIDKNYEMLPRLQKNIIELCNKQGKPAVVGSQLLESMNKNKYPSKAEVYDIANAVLDKTSCLMLSSETESGKYPIEATDTLTKIIKNVEIGQTFSVQEKKDDILIDSIGASIFEEDKPINIDAILIITSGGYTARVVSSKRSRCKIIAATSSKKIFRQLNILWGIEPLFINTNLEDISNEEKKESLLKALKKGFIKKTDQILIMASVFHSRSKRANLLEIHKVNEFLNYLYDKDKIKVKV